MHRALEYQFPNTETWLDGQGRKRWRIPGGQLREFFSVSAEEVVALELGIAHLNRSGLKLEGKALEAIRDKILAFLPSSQASRIEPDTVAVLEVEGYGLCNLSSGNCIERCSRILASPLYICLCVSAPLFIDFDEDGANEPHERVFIREDPHFGCASF